MRGEFVILINGELKIYTDYEEVPESFDNLIKFLPEYPDPPHSKEHHEIMDTYNDKIQELIGREIK